MWSGILWFWFLFPWWLMMLNIFSSAYCPFVHQLEEMFIQVLCSFLNWVVCYFVVELEFSIYSGFMFCIYFLLSCGLSFHSIVSVLWCTKVFNFDEVQFICLFLFLPILFLSCPSSHCQSNVMKISLFSSKSFTVLVLIFRPLIYLEFIFAYGVR